MKDNSLEQQSTKWVGRNLKVLIVVLGKQSSIVK